MAKKKVFWGKGKYSSNIQKPGYYNSFSEFIEKANKRREEQEKAISYLNKALPAMLKLLELRMTNKEPIMVMRPLKYKTSLSKAEIQRRDNVDDINKSFYNNAEVNEASNSGFVDVEEVIYPGTKLILKSLYPPMREFIFIDGTGKEHAISYDDRNSILTQTNIFETIQKLFEN